MQKNVIVLLLHSPENKIDLLFLDKRKITTKLLLKCNLLH